jgi:hypothetical protein
MRHPKKIADSTWFSVFGDKVLTLAVFAFLAPSFWAFQLIHSNRLWFGSALLAVWAVIDRLDPVDLTPPQLPAVVHFSTVHCLGHPGRVLNRVENVKRTLEFYRRGENLKADLLADYYKMQKSLG